VLILPNERDDEWLQLIAREFNFSETVFLVKRSNTRNGRGFVSLVSLAERMMMTLIKISFAE
jgi:hypothetical protein